MTKEPVFSVIIPTYNRAGIIRRAIESILCQTFRQFELIIVDDGSTDNTKEHIASYQDDRIIYVYKENGGQNSALNKGLEIASGKYIAFCDSDDAWLPQKLEKTYQKYLSDESISVVYHWTGICINNKVELAREDVLEGNIYRAVLKQGYLTSPTFLSCKKECFETIGLFDLKIINCQDDDFCFNLCKYFKVGLIKEILGIYYSDVAGRKSEMKRVGADSYLCLINKHKEDIIEICGKRIMAKKYLNAANNYMLLDDIEKAKEIYHLSELCGIGLVDKIKFLIRWRNI